MYGCLFFFFEGEDGIRDATVTGVQTCALPISPPAIPTGWWLVVGPRPVVGCCRRRLARGSGEGRGGEECRSRGAPDHSKKKKNQDRETTEYRARRLRPLYMSVSLPGT